MNVAELVASGVSLEWTAASPRVRRFAEPASKRTDVRVMRALRHGDREGLELAIRVELPQRPAYPLQAEELILLAWESPSDEYPGAFPLRADFPLTPHRSLVDRGTLGLCLYEQSLNEIRASLTPARFIARVGQWLDRAAMGTLHVPGQRLEPFVLGAAPLVCLEEFLAGSPDDLVLVEGMRSALGVVYFAQPIPAEKAKQAIKSCQFVPLVVPCAPSEGTIVHRFPRDYNELAEIVAAAGVCLDDRIRTATHRLFERDKLLLEKNWIFLLDLPKTREGVAEGHDHLAFALMELTVGELGIQLGDLDRRDGAYGLLITRVPGPKRDVGVPVAFNPLFVLTSERARKLAGIEDGPWTQRRVVSIGAGALGSQVVMDLVRQGIAHWTIVDRDFLLPHNLGRHALDFRGVGGDKATALRMRIRSTLDIADADTEALSIDVLDPKHQAALAERLKPPAAVLDLTASRAVLQHLSSLTDRGPILSAYLTRQGEYLVALAEGADPQLRLEDLDIEFAAAGAFDAGFGDVFVGSDATVRFGGSCHDMAAVLPQTRVALWAAVLAERALQWLREPGPAWVSYWKFDRDSQEVARCVLDLPLAPAVHQYAEWQLRISRRALDEVRRLREAALPNETCGVLVGALDLVRRVVYVARAISAPGDALPSPAGSERGNRHLNQVLDGIHSRSGNVLTYVGEWHSHPKGASSMPSTTDLAANARLMTVMAAEGLPTAMLIQGERDYSTLFASPVGP